MTEILVVHALTSKVIANYIGQRFLVKKNNKMYMLIYINKEHFNTMCWYVGQYV